jgi:hypothetical protein
MQKRTDTRSFAVYVAISVLLAYLLISALLSCEVPSIGVAAARKLTPRVDGYLDGSWTAAPYGT